ncbi:MAG: LON peptidase substrate-binding domain-containing protein, partial [Acidimicrobiales bacterium]|nr:LON peptidase substrate-binding domain-containing protein [Acidimicrobiales bacterium]
MFPLESPILPGQPIPLHLFEPRYRQLAHDLAQVGEPEFGIVGIARGREIGGEDVRTDVGVVARVVQSEEQADGR